LTIPSQKVDNDSLQYLINYSERTNYNLEELKVVFFEPAESPLSKKTIMEAKEAILLLRIIDHLFPKLERVGTRISSDFSEYFFSDWDPWHRSVERMVKIFREARSGFPAKGLNIHQIVRNRTAAH